MTIINKIVNIVSDFPKAITFLFIGITLYSMTTVPKLTNDPNPYLLDKNHPVREKLDNLRETYSGSRDSIIVLLESKDTIFNNGTLLRIKRLTEEFEKIILFSNNDIKFLKYFKTNSNNELKGLLNVFLNSEIDENSWEEFNKISDLIHEQNSLTPHEINRLKAIRSGLNPVIEVNSLSNTDNITGNDDRIEIKPLYNKTPLNPNQLDLIEKNALDNKLFSDFLITGNSKYSCIVIELAINESETDNQYSILNKVKDILENKIPGDEQHYIAGFPVVTAIVGHTMETDSGRLLPIVLVLVVSCLWLSFRMAIGIVIPLVVVICSLVITLALKVMFNIPMNIVTSALPVFILSIGVADGIHMFTVYRDHLLSGDDRKTAVRKTARELSGPVIMTSITTAAAFITLSVTEIVQIKNFGIFVSAGVMIAMVYSIIFIPALLLTLPKFTIKNKGNFSKIDLFLTSSLSAITNTAMTHRLKVVALFIIAVFISLYGTYHVKVENNPISYHKPDTELVVATNKINSVVAGTLNLNILVTAKSTDPEPFTDPKNLLPVTGLIEHIEKNAFVGKVFSLTKLIERLNYIMHNNNPQFDTIPGITGMHADKPDRSARNLISQYLFLYENSGGDILGDVVNSTYTQLNIPIVLKTNSSITVGTVMDEIEQYIQDNFPENLIVEFNGSANEMVAATNEIVSSQITSLMISFVIIFFFLIITFRSVIIGLLAIIPLVVTVLTNFGIMGIFGISLDIGTTVIGGIAIGIGIDYSIHYLSRFKKYLGKGLSPGEAISKTVQHSGKAIMLNAFTVGTGFLAMLFSVFKPLTTMGWMITSTMLVSSLCTILLLPAVLSLFPADFLRTIISGNYPMGEIPVVTNEEHAA